MKSHELTGNAVVVNVVEFLAHRILSSFTNDTAVPPKGRSELDG